MNVKTTKNTKTTLKLALVGLLALSTLILPGAWAADDDKVWSDTAEFSLVSTSGNSETMTLGFKNTLSRAWDRSAFALKAGGVLVESTTTSTFAVRRH